ncbi:MAG TPA: ribonuclease H-like domain-containing protein, partial [Myxococcales bacterium]|nr:ribonuclease H-like domain-containing protein [Myxococcales bacterium]
HVTERRYAPGHRHGRVPVCTALAARPEHVAALALDPSLASVPLDRALLLDTETTGLAGGAGTLPFLIGLGWFDPEGGGALALEQLFLERPGQERPMLAHLAERLAAATCVVSFNGKSYDWPLLRTRFVMNRMPVPALPPHLDLLHCARRAYRHRCESARLVELESQVVGHARRGDVPGHLIPELYFSYLRHRALGPLRRVLDHNAQDLLMLAALLGHLAGRFAAPAEAEDARDALGLAEVAFRARDGERADAFAAVAAGGPRPDLASAALVIRARVCWRRRDVAGAVAFLERAVALAPRPLAPRLHLALAKLLEHRLRDLEGAMRHAALAGGAEPPARAERRVRRLGEKLARAQAVTAPSGRPARCSPASSPG